MKVSVSTNKEDAKFFNDTQKNVKLSIENSYNQLTKVDKEDLKEALETIDDITQLIKDKYQLTRFS